MIKIINNNKLYIIITNKILVKNKWAKINVYLKSSFFTIANTLAKSPTGTTIDSTKNLEEFILPNDFYPKIVTQIIIIIIVV